MTLTTFLSFFPLTHHPPPSFTVLPPPQEREELPVPEEAGSSFRVEHRNRGYRASTGGQGKHWHRDTPELQVPFPGGIPLGRRKVTPTGEQKEMAQPSKVQIYELGKTKIKGSSACLLPASTFVPQDLTASLPRHHSC